MRNSLPRLPHVITVSKPVKSVTEKAMTEFKTA